MQIGSKVRTNHCGIPREGLITDIYQEERNTWYEVRLSGGFSEVSIDRLRGELINLDDYFVVEVSNLHKQMLNFYTGRAGNVFLSADFQQAFAYSSRSAAEHKAAVLNQMTGMRFTTMSQDLVDYFLNLV